MSELTNEQELVEEVEYEAEDADVIPMPIDPTLSNQGEAADAKATGDAIREVGTRLGGGTLPESTDNLTDAIIAVNNRIGSGNFPGDQTTVINALNYIVGTIGDEELPGEASTITEALTMVAEKIGAGSLAEKYADLTDAINTIDALIGDTNLPSGSTSITEAISKMVSGGLVSSVNGEVPDENGNVIVDVGVKTVNNRTPTNGNVTINTGVMTVNGETPNATGELSIREVEYANNLISDNVQVSEMAYITRTSGGNASIDDGDAWLVRLRGRRTHTGVVAETLDMTVIPMQREAEEGEETPEAITAVMDKAVFRAYVNNSATIDIFYTNAWSSDPVLYGITVTGDPVSGDQIHIVYIKEDRGIIAQSTPAEFISTGFNLYDHSNGYAKVIKYSDQFGFKISGTYTSLQFSETFAGTKSTITPVNGAFNVPSDGFVFVTGGNSTDTAIWMTWSDWTEGYSGDFAPYTESVIDLTEAMAYFPNGLLQCGTVYDEIDLNTQVAIQRIERIAYTDGTIAIIKASGREYECDRNYIYAVLNTPVTNSISIDGQFTVSAHGVEVIDGTTVAVYAETLYGSNLKNKLERDVLTISQQTLTESQKTQVRNNACSARKPLPVNMGTISSLPVTMNAPGVTETMVCRDARLGDESAMAGNWTVTTGNGTITLSGAISSSRSTTVVLYLEEVDDEVTATAVEEETT